MPIKLTNNCSSLYLFFQNLLTILYTLDSVYQKNCRLNHKKQYAPVYIYYPAPLYIYQKYLVITLLQFVFIKPFSSPLCSSLYFFTKNSLKGGQTLSSNKDDVQIR